MDTLLDVLLILLLVALGVARVARASREYYPKRSKY